MDRIINVQVTGCTVVKDSKNAGVQGEANAATLRITFSPEWVGLSKKIIWLDAGGGNPVEKILTTETDGAFETTIPGEPLTKAGQCCFTIQGVKDSIVAMAVTEHLDVLPNDSYGMEAGNAADPTPSVADQLNEKISAAVYTVNGAKPDASGNVNTPGAGTGGEVVSVNGKNGIVVLTMGDVAYSGAGAHNAIYRGKYLGSAVTAAQWAAISAGTFEDLYIGDYWVIGEVTYRIAAFDYYYKTGDTSCDTHHVTVVPDTSMHYHAMNDSNVTTGGYIGSKMRTTGLADAKTTINNAFGSAHILTHRQYLCNAVSNGKPSGGSWYDSTVELMTEQNVYGGKVYGAGNDGSTVPTLHTLDKSQYPLFVFRPDLISNRDWFWLRDVVSAADFATVSNSGGCYCYGASDVGGVRPSCCIYGG